MSISKTFSSETSGRYASAIFEVAEEAKEFDQTEKDLRSILILYNSNKYLSDFIKNPTQNIKSQESLILKISEVMGLSKNLKNFLLLLVKKRRIFFIDNIIKRFLELVSKRKGMVKASLVSSKKLLENEILDISNEISKSIKSQVELKYSIDKSLISGIKLQVGSLLVDSSLKNKIKKLKMQMIEN